MRTVRPAEEGIFRPASLAGLFLALAEQRFSGALRADGAPGSKQVYFIEGQPVFVQSNIREEALGRLLMTSGRITEEQYRAVIEESAETGQKVGTLLISRGIVPAGELTRYLCAQTATKIASLFAWKEGTYRLSPDVRYPENTPTFEAGLYRAIMEGYRRYYRAELIDASFVRHKNLHPVPSKNPLLPAPEMTPEEKTLAVSLDGRHAFGDVVARSALGLMDTVRVIYGLVAAGLCRLAEAAEERASVPAVKPEAPPSSDAPPETGAFENLERVAASLGETTYYELLGVAPDATKKEIEKAYQKAKAEFAPDALPAGAPPGVRRRAQAIVRKIDEAWDTLSDPLTRRRYTRQAGGPPAPDSNDPDAQARKRKMDAEAVFQKD
ncbi:MAG: DnaJ domain-containing protein [Deltaproteobacteria bacterium]|nr:DnaJ domain-containing protein [Deltaproteobacteria bacterium]